MACWAICLAVEGISISAWKTGSIKLRSLVTASSPAWPVSDDEDRRFLFREHGLAEPAGEFKGIFGGNAEHIL